MPSRSTIWHGSATCLLIACISIILPPRAATADNPPDKTAADGDLEQRIAHLILDLGNPQFAVRQHAQAELAQVGLAAFDALNEAQSDPDVEVSLRAGSLLKAIEVDWSNDSDPPEVKRTLRGYGEQPALERKARIDRLALIDERGGLSALARLVRYERDELVARYAAVRLLVPSQEADPKVRANWIKVLNQTAGTSKRPVVSWLRLYARTLEDPAATLNDWQKLVDREYSLLRLKEGVTNELLVRELFRWQAQLLIQQQERQKALVVMRRSLEMVDGSKDQVVDLVNWFTQQEAWEIIEETYQRFPEIFADHPALLYRVAEAQLRLGRKEDAEKMADEAARAKPDRLDEHLQAGLNLQNRGLFAWSEREYSLVIERGADASFYSVRGCFYLSEMQHDQARHGAAAKTLQNVVTWMEEGAKKNDVLNMVASWGREPGAIRSRWHYFRALELSEKGDLEGERKELDLGVDSETGDPTDADVLIALYRLPEQSAEQQKKTQELIDTAVAKFRDEIQAARAALEGAANENEQARASIELAMANNQMAWLIGNTAGDFDEAIQASHRSLELRPETAAYFDTLARCYYAKGNFVEAIKYQKLALKQEPHSGQMQRQLAMIEKAQAKKE